MVWLFLDRSKPAQARHYEATINKIDSWWQTFRSRLTEIESYLENKTDWQIEEFMNSHLQQIDENLMWEFGQESQDGLHLVITPESERHLRPLVGEIVDRAPELDNWTFYCYRQPQTTAETSAQLKEQLGLELKDLSFRASTTSEQSIDLQFKATAKIAKNKLYEATLTASEYLLGEEILDRWIGEISLGGKGDNYISVDELPNTIYRLIEGQKLAMPAKRLMQMRHTLNAVTFEADEQYSADNDDEFNLIKAKTLVPAIWQAAHSDMPFDSCRFSRFGEKFAYIKIDKLIEQSRLDTLEAALNKALVASGSGCTTGNGISERFGFIDLCLTDIAKAIQSIHQTIDNKWTETCWLQFFDADWKDERVALQSSSSS